MIPSRLRLVVVLSLLSLALLLQGDGLSPPARAGDFDLCPATGSPLGPFDVISYDPEDYRTVYNQTFELAAVNGLFPNDLHFGLPPLETGPRQSQPMASPTETPTPTPEGSPTPTETATSTPEGSPTPTETATPTPEGSPTETAADIAVAVVAGSPTPTPTIEDSWKLMETAVPTIEDPWKLTETPTPTPEPSPTPTETASPTPEGSPTPTETATPTPTPVPFPPMSSGVSEPYVPPTILKAIGWIESSWSQAAFHVPYGGIGPALVSRDCGYGIMQVTSGMQNTTGEPTKEQLMTAAHFAYNIARGTRILVDKWNLATDFRPIVGDRNPQVIEDWYYAIWGYNGFVFVNHPLNPRFPAWPRSSYSCGPFDDGFGHDRSQYPYQELVLGCVAHPPEPDDEPLWQALEVTLPDLSLKDFAEALKLENFACDSSDYCYDNMDMPRPANSHVDPTEVGSDRRSVLGAPVLEVSDLDLDLTVRPEGLSQPVEVTISNSGTGVLVWTAVPSASWLGLSRKQGLAFGDELEMEESILTIQANLAGLPKSEYVGTITLEAPYVTGNSETITVTVNVRAQSFVPGITKS